MSVVTTPNNAETIVESANRTLNRTAFVTAFSLTSEQIQEANRQTIENIKLANTTPPVGAICPAGFVVLWGNAEIAAYMGIEKIDDTIEANKSLPHLFRWKVAAKQYDRYRATNNGTNRALNESNWQDSLLKYFVENKWALTGETCIRDQFKRVLSAQHRMVAAYIATLINPSLKFYFIVIDGVADCVGDFIDTGKSRDFKDISGRHQDAFLPVDTLRMLNDTPYHSDVTKVRTKTINDIKQSLNLLWLRGRGTDINGSTTEYKNNKAEYENMVARFSPMEFVDANGVTVQSTELERAAMRIFAYDQQQGGVINKYFGRGKLLTAIVLASNVDNESDIRVDKIQSASGSEREVISVEYPESLSVDFQLLEEFCQIASQLTGPFAAYYNDKTKLSTDKAGFVPRMRFGAMVNLIKHFRATRIETHLEPIVNEAGESVVPPVQVTCAPIGKASEVLPKPPRKSVSKAGQEITLPFDYPHFGGFDCGMIDKEQVKTDQTLANVQEEYASESEANAS